MPSRLRLASIWAMIDLRERPFSLGPEPIGPLTLVATTISSRRANSRSQRPVTTSLSPIE
jgi:hypothetical protein